jgi:Protein of unknown function (DUF2439)
MLISYDSQASFSFLLSSLISITFLFQTTRTRPINFLSKPNPEVRKTNPSLSNCIAMSGSVASVFEFQCLYSVDIRRKVKRWNDGFLRYHTTNRRAMVYDTTAHFVGDLHWRELRGIQEGDELELETGVLVLVGETKSKTTTATSTPTTPGRQPPRSIPISVPTLGPPKSLNDVLGIVKKTPIVQPRTSSSSTATPPRQESSPSEERPRKRPRHSPKLKEAPPPRPAAAAPPRPPPEPTISNPLRMSHGKPQPRLRYQALLPDHHGLSAAHPVSIFLASDDR